MFMATYMNMYTNTFEVDYYIQRPAVSTSMTIYLMLSLSTSDSFAIDVMQSMYIRVGLLLHDIEMAGWT